ncbi:MAG: hypothetical protein ACREGJ_04510 [Candidatus Saccharimonadales bacterium]
MQPQYYGAAAKYNKPRGFQFNGRTVMMIALGFVGLILITIGFVLVGSLTSGPKNNLAALVVREEQLQTFIKNAQGKIKSGDLAKINSDAHLLIATDSLALRAQLGTVYGQKKISDDIVKREADSASAKKLADAELINAFDTTYSRILRDKLASAFQLANKVRLESKNSNLKKVLAQAITNLETIDKQVADLKL